MEEEAFFGSGGCTQGNDWRAEVRQAPFGLSLTIESGPSSHRTVIALPLSIGRAQALRRILGAALIEAGEAVD